MHTPQTAMDAIVRKTMEMDLVWDWPGGVAYYGVARAAQTSGSAEYWELLQARVDELIDAGLPKNWTVNACAMGHCLLFLHEKTGVERYLEIIESKVDYLQHHAPRFAQGVLQHTVSANDDFPQQAWADTLFMAAYFLLRAGVALGREELKEDALAQWKWHIHYLQNPETALWYHGYDHLRQNHMSAFHWARANSWAAYTMARVQGELKQWYLYPDAMDAQCSLRDLLAALRRLQTENGLWRTVLDDPGSYEEMSASCGIAAAMALGKNPLHKKHVALALEGLLQNVAPDGRVLGVSGGTAVMRDLEGYRNISRAWVQGWGQGLALALLCAWDAWD